MEYSNKDYVKQFLRLLGYVMNVMILYFICQLQLGYAMILYFIYLIKYIFFDLPNELKKWSFDPDLDNIINKLKRLNINEENVKILVELRDITIKIEDMIGKKCIEKKTKFKFLNIITSHILKLEDNNSNLFKYKFDYYDEEYEKYYYQTINTNRKKTKSNDEIIQNLESLRKVIENFWIKDHPLDY